LYIIQLTSTFQNKYILGLDAWSHALYHKQDMVNFICSNMVE